MKYVYVIFQIFGDPDSNTTFELVEIHASRDSAVEEVAKFLSDINLPEDIFMKSGVVHEATRDEYEKANPMTDWIGHYCCNDGSLEGYPQLYLIEQMKVLDNDA